MAKHFGEFKTCNSGVPFGVVCKGFLSKGSHHWVYKFLTCLDSMLALADSGQIDFLLPDVSDPASPLLLSAMPYSTALCFFRHFMSLPWRKTPLVFGNITHYTIHGLKSTFLSWASQLKLDPESRRLQGHHKDPLKSARLYSRDDIDGSIFVQETIIQKIQEGWRPHTPLSRGGQLPLQEPQVILESFKKEAVYYQWLFFSFGDPNHVLILPEPDASLQSESSSSGSSSDSSSSDRTDEPTKKKATKVPLVDFSSVEELEMASYRKTLHMIMNWDDDSNSSGFRSTRTACGKSFPSDTVKPHAEIPQDSNIKFCTHPGCRKGWIALGALAWLCSGMKTAGDSFRVMSLGSLFFGKLASVLGALRLRVIKDFFNNAKKDGFRFGSATVACYLKYFNKVSMLSKLYSHNMIAGLLTRVTELTFSFDSTAVMTRLNKKNRHSFGSAQTGNQVFAFVWLFIAYSNDLKLECSP